MKITEIRKLIFAAVLFPALANSYPGVGDKAVYGVEVKSKSGDTLRTGETVARVMAFDAGNKKFEVLVATTLGGQREESRQWVDANSLYTPENYREIMSTCGSMGGETENVEVPAGRFRSCGLKIPEGRKIVSIWYGDVPFGVVKTDTFDRSTEETTSEVLRGIAHGEGE